MKTCCQFKPAFLPGQRVRHKGLPTKDYVVMEVTVTIRAAKRVNLGIYIDTVYQLAEVGKSYNQATNVGLFVGEEDLESL